MARLKERRISLMSKFKSVRDFFSAEHKDLVSNLNSGTGLWNKIRENTITNSELLDIIRRVPEYATDHKGAKALYDGRRAGKVANPA